MEKVTMTNEKAIEVVYPVFSLWARRVKKEKKLGEIDLIKLWYRYLEEIRNEIHKSKSINLES